MIVVICGVAGSGKSTIGRLLGERTGWPFLDADDYHAAASKAKMAAGIPLTDEDRQQWLETLHAMLLRHSRQGDSLVLACSALTDKYRSMLLQDVTEAHLVWLEGDYSLLRRRIESRPGHFFPGQLLLSQLELAERPLDGKVYDTASSPEDIVAHIVSDLYITPTPKK